MPAYATKRISLRWLPEAAYEDTDTLVLSVNEYFVDARIKKDYKSIDWAFAGTKRIEEDGRNVWTHAIDSRGSTEEDSGYITVLDNGDEIERGSMRNPATGTVMSHEELWRGIHLVNGSGLIARNADGKSWIAIVDPYCLLVSIDEQGSWIARYELMRETKEWHQVYSLGISPLLAQLSTEFINGISTNLAWHVLALVDV